jgi:hypothetical protein
MHSLAMEEVFVDLSLMPELPYRVPTGAVSGGVQKAVVQDSERQSIWQLLERYPNEALAVLGPPGSGKTTLLRHVTLALCGYQRQFKVARQWRRKIPVLLFLRQHVTALTENPDMTLVEAIRATLTQLPKAEPSGWLESQLDKGRCIVMLDGLDEVPRRDDRAIVMEWTRNQIQRYPRNRFILTSRPGGFNDPALITATTVQVREFNDVQIRRFVRGWYWAVEERSTNRKDIGVALQAEDGANQLLDRIYASPALLALGPNPLLLTMIASVHKYRAALPGSRTELYREICQVFLGKRQEAKQLPLAQSIEQQLLVLRRLAFGMMVGRVRDIGVEEAEKIINPVLLRLGYTGNANSFLREIEHGSGLLVEHEAEVYSFAHLTFQEYLAALHIADLSNTDFLIGQLSDPWWREVILFRIATADATSIMRAIQQTRDQGAELLSLADECLEQARDIDPAVRREVTELLSWRKNAAPERQQLVAHVLMRRKLRHVIRTGNGTFVCPNPVTNAEYAMFIHDSPYKAGVRREPRRYARGGRPDEPVMGVDPTDAVNFTEWARQIGIQVRLPFDGDLSPSDLQRLASPPKMQFWIRGAHHMPVLTHPQNPSLDNKILEQWLGRQIVTDVERVLAGDNIYAPPYFTAANKGLPVADWIQFLLEAGTRDGKEQIVEARPYFFENRFPEALLKQVLTQHPLGPPIPDIDKIDTFPHRYRSLLPDLLNTIRHEWETGSYWRAPQSEAWLRPGLSLLIGRDVEATYLRAYLRIMAWDELLGVLAALQRWQGGHFIVGEQNGVTLRMGGGHSRSPHMRPKKMEDIKTRSMRGLAWQYLYEWQVGGSLPSIEGILLARA